MKKKRKINPRAEPKAIQTNDAFQNPLSRAGVFMPNLLEATQYPLTRFTQNWQQINSLYRSHWVVRRVIDVMPEDMMKNGYKILSQLEPDQIKQITKVERQTRINSKILEGLRWGRLYGGAGGLILLEGHEDILDQPLEYDQIMPDSFKGLLIMDRWSGITPESELITDISDPDFGLPAYYTVTTDSMERGIRIHHSRICRFMGRDLPYLERLAETYWGASELEHVFDELKKRDNVSWNMAMLTFMANIRVLKMEGMEQIFATGSEKALQDLYATVQAQNAMMNNNGLQILGNNDEYQSHQYAFSGLGEVYDRFMMDLAGAAETPVTKLFGRSPAGMNATGESDMQNYYDTIEEKQESDLRPIYDKLLPVIMMSSLGAIPDDFDYDFRPVRRLKDTEQSDLASKNTDSITKVFLAGGISQKTLLKELREQSETTGMWSNITDEDIERADEDVMQMNDLPLNSNLTTDSDFKEEDHPRDGDGKFASGGGEKEPLSQEKVESALSPVKSHIFKNGFSRSNLKTHFEKHKGEYPDLNEQEYAKQALDLVQQEVDGKIIFGYLTKNNRIVRYNNESNDFVSGNPDIGIATMMKLNGGIKRFLYLKNRDGKKD